MQNDHISRVASTPVKKFRIFSIVLEEIAMKDPGSRTSFLHPSKMRHYFQSCFEEIPVERSHF